MSLPAMPFASAYFAVHRLFSPIFCMSDWDKYFWDVCVAVASNSKCLSRKLGAIIVRDKTIVGTGYNGPPRGIPECSKRLIEGVDPFLTEEFKLISNRVKETLKNQCPRRILGLRSGEGLEWCVAGHAERNALINSARLGISTLGAKMYMNCGVPCKDCMVEIINAGIEEIVVSKWQFYDNMSKYLLTHSGLKVRIYDF